MGTRRRGSVRRRLLGFTIGLAVAALALGAPGGAVVTAYAAVDPSTIVLSPSDLPPGFEVDPTRTSASTVNNVGPLYQVAMKRPFTPELFAAGPVFVIQQALRLDSGIGAGDALKIQRDYWVNRGGYPPTDAGPNDDGTFSLAKTDQGFTTYVVGFIKENMILVTAVGGVDSVISYGNALELAGMSSAKLDAALGR